MNGISGILGRYRWLRVITFVAIGWTSVLVAVLCGKGVIIGWEILYTLVDWMVKY